MGMTKEKILNHSKSVSEVAYELGLKYQQHFTQLFSLCVGHSHKEYLMLD